MNTERIALVGTFYKTLDDARNQLVKKNNSEELVIIPVPRGYLLVNEKQLSKLTQSIHYEPDNG